MLRHYSMILTASAHMRREYINQGFDRRRVRTVALIIDALPNRSIITDSELIASSRRKFDADCLQLLFLGRMVKLKGGEKLLDAAPTTVASLQRPVRITFAGDGPARPDWARRAAWLEAGFRQIRVEFRGWTADLGELAMRSHLLVMPSLWPEPFGLSGLEIGRWGVPSVGFAVGGIPEWLLEGVNGHLAPSEPATAHGLANAIVHSLCDRDHYTRLCLGASARVDRYTAAVHVKRLTDIFDEVLGA
jgi:glycosyltransferase involved in cell wall biosynthesis